jgi:hypothetical protein
VLSVPATTSQQIDDQLEQVLKKAGARDRTAIEKRLAILDSDPDPARGTCWRQLLANLSGLVPLPVNAVGANALRFFVPDGKYRMQVFALEDASDGLLIVYLPDVLAKAVRNKLLVKNADRYSPADAPDQPLTIERMDVNTPNPPELMKHMLGWNRKALKLTLHVSPRKTVQLKAVEELCELAAAQWDLPEGASK